MSRITRVPLTAQLLTGLSLGLISGILISLAPQSPLSKLPSYVEPLGTLWANAIRMTVLPLLAALLVTAIVGQARSSAVAALGARAIGLFIVFIAGSSALAGLAGPGLMARLQVDPAAAAAMRAASTGAAARELPPFRNWLVELIPSNPVRAAADGALIPFIAFVVLFALAANSIRPAARALIADAFDALKQAMFVLVGWILAVAPIGIFALVLPLAARLGTDAARAFGYFTLITAALIVLATAALYPVVTVLAGVRLSAFARACIPAQVVGFTTRSSLASLPAMVTAAEKLGLAVPVSGVTLPVAVSLFKFASPIGRVLGTFLIARLYGIDLGAEQVVMIAVAVGTLSFYSPGIPSGGLLVMAPVYAMLGLPIEGIGLLIALDVILDMFITASNVTADIATAVLVNRATRMSTVAVAEPRVPV